MPPDAHKGHRPGRFHRRRAAGAGAGRAGVGWGLAPSLSRKGEAWGPDPFVLRRAVVLTYEKCAKFSRDSERVDAPKEEAATGRHNAACRTPGIRLHATNDARLSQAHSHAFAGDVL